MERPSEYKKFFRLRSSIGVTIGDRKVTPWWLADSLRYIDYSHDVLFEESLAVSQIFPGLFRFDDIKNLRWDVYEKLIDRVRKIQKEQEGINASK